ncbi:acyl transferase/acyl hydrolase/lysophospholipase [Paraphoma chrysanthemicola]|nr:acyl transferase/acyl hydrolase/lysophospholipase [Paraphoma chrysanthemicola]
MAPKTAPNDNPVSILSVDGGGIKGITALGMLQKIMEDVNQDRDPANYKKPCDVFDLICGTSTGGLIALMLGRLQYTVEQATEKYLELGENIFRKKESWWDATYDHATLENGIKKVVRESPINADQDPELMYKPEGRRKCKTFVVTTSLVEDTPQPVVLRDYDIRSKSGNIAHAFPGTIWEAGRCTSAAPTYFRPITVETGDGFRTYSDGGTISNNPINEAIVEAARLWEPSRIKIIVSLGAGPEKEHTLTNSPADVMGPWAAWSLNLMASKRKNFEVQLATYAVQAMTSTERLHHRAEAMVESFQGPVKDLDRPVGRKQIYFRLNPSDPAAQVDLAAYLEMPKLQRIAEEYMNRDIVALSYRQMIVSVIRNRILTHDPNSDLILERQAAYDARRVMNKEYRFPVQIFGMESDPQRDLSLVGRLLSWFRPGVASKSGKVHFQGAYNYHQDHNVISEALARRLKYPFPDAPLDGLGQPLSKPFNVEFKHSATIDIAMGNGSQTVKIEKVWFYIAEGIDLPCDVILGRETFSSSGLSEHMPRLMVQDWYDGPADLWGDNSPYHIQIGFRHYEA